MDESKKVLEEKQLDDSDLEQVNGGEDKTILSELCDKEGKGFSTDRDMISW